MESDAGPDRNVDVIVVGSGIAGSMAALGAKEAGAAIVLLIEKKTLYGGTSRLSKGGFAATVISAKNNPQGAVDAWRDYMTAGAEVTGYPDYDKFLALAENSAEAVDYLRSLGLSIIGQVAGEGSTLMTKLESAVRAQNIEILFSCEANELITENGAVTGLKAVRNRKSFTVKAQNVILATGGFSKNPELVAGWAGNNPGLNYVVSMADSGSAGDGILMARQAGAALYDNTFTKAAGFQFSPALGGISAFAQPWNSPIAQAPLSTQILINREARRFMNEAAGGSYNNVSWYNYQGAYAMIKDGKGPYFIIYDSNNTTTVTLSLEAGAALNVDEAFKGETIDEIAALTGVPEEILADTVDGYNDFCTAGLDGDFGKTGPDLKKIEAGPFYAVKLYPNSYGSMGGVVTDSEGRVYNTAGEIIPHLYAVGEVSNRDYYNQTFVVGASLALYSAIGRTAGKAAALNP
jgi:fumarate reductase flavoprotein subunit